jgi:hypothetical protein
VCVLGVAGEKILPLELTVSLTFQGTNYIRDGYPVLITGWAWVTTQIADGLEVDSLNGGNPTLGELNDVS